MTKISKIHITHFRSIKSITVDSNYLTLLVGQNDAGKSNILRALNLFFNGQTNHNTNFNFEDDHYFLDRPNRRAQEIEISIEFDLPDSYRSTNGDRIVWTKAWRSHGLVKTEYHGVRISKNRRGTEVYTDVKIPDKSNVHALLRQIEFVYVPAIKDARYFDDLRGDIYTLISEVATKTFRESSRSFEKSIADHLCDLTSDISLRLGIDTNLALPKDLRHVFERLDFLSGEYTVSLANRGDGIKARHIPIILKFMAQKKKQLQNRGAPPYTFVWGYEEPENNIEISRCFEMADEFWSYMYDGVAQIFITTHSPVFYNLNNKGASGEDFVRLHHVILDAIETGSKIVTNPSDINERMGMARLLSPYVAEEEHRWRAREAARVEAERLSEHSSRTVFVEGASDAKIMRRAAKIFAPHVSDLITFECSVNGGGHEYVKDMLIAWHHIQKYGTAPKPAAGLFDADKPGETSKHEVDQIVNKMAAKTFKLPVPPHLQSVRHKGIHLPITLECLYPEAVWQFSKRANHLEDRPLRQILPDKHFDQIARKECSLEDVVGNDAAIYVFYDYKLEKKGVVADHICGKDDASAKENLANFCGVVRSIAEYLFPDVTHPWQASR